MPQIELIYATKEKQQLLILQVEEGATIESCIKQSGILSEYPEIDLEINKVGIFSQVKPLTQTVREGDRIEIYRALIADPKVVRRQKAELAQKR